MEKPCHLLEEKIFKVPAKRSDFVIFCYFFGGVPLQMRGFSL